MSFLRIRIHILNKHVTIWKGKEYQLDSVQCKSGNQVSVEINEPNIRIPHLFISVTLGRLSSRISNSDVDNENDKNTIFALVKKRSHGL